MFAPMTVLKWLKCCQMSIFHCFCLCLKEYKVWASGLKLNGLHSILITSSHKLFDSIMGLPYNLVTCTQYYTDPHVAHTDKTISYLICPRTITLFLVRFICESYGTSKNYKTHTHTNLVSKKTVLMSSVTVRPECFWQWRLYQNCCY